MVRANTGKRSPEITARGDVLDLKRLGRSRAGSQLPETEKKRDEKAKDEPQTLYQRPSTGRTTALGRKVEKPAPEKVGGPSGQTDQGQHDRKHTNK